MEELKNIIKNMNLSESFNEEEVFAQMKQKYLSCPQAVRFVASLGVSDDAVNRNIIKINDMVNDIEYCKNCKGIEKCQKENPLLITKLVNSGGEIERELTPCKRILEKAMLEAQIKIRDFEPEWFTSEIANLDMSKGRKTALMKYLAYTKDEGDDWLYLTGSQNTGRSYFAATLALDLARKGKGPICFINSSLRLKELVDLSYSNKEAFQRRLDLYTRVPVLIIDDFGSEYKTDFVRDGILLQMLVKRSAKKLFTIFTSDYTIEEIKELYSTSKAGTIQAKRLDKIIRSEAKKEINLGEVSVY